MARHPGLIKVKKMENKEVQLLEAVSPTLQYMGIRLDNPHTITVNRGRCYAVIGENGSGKTTLGNIIEKGWNIGLNAIHGDKQHMLIKNIEFSDIHSLTGCKQSYYQQRYEATQNDDIPTVDELIAGKISEEQWNDLCERLKLRDIRHKRVNYLSSGELRKFLIINLFTTIPDLLIIDNPYIGLDAPSRELFNELIASITAQGTAVMLLLCNTIDIPDFTHYIVPMKNLQIGKTITVDREHIAETRKECEKLFTPHSDDGSAPLPLHAATVPFTTAFELRHCNVHYGQNTILHDICWQVNAGEHWALIGENGSGKSTLLSLVYADNPQGYSNDISLFDHKRGTGESIWEIKRNIGYISPEMHLYFQNGETLLTVVATGCFDNVGCYRRAGEEQNATAMLWLKAMGLDRLASRRFSTLSSGEQRLGLLARTFIKNAPLLILDEPLHGLDAENKRMIRQIIDRMTSGKKMSLIYVTHYAHEIPQSVTRTFRLVKNQGGSEI